jgi:hypothetical protein
LRVSFSPWPFIWTHLGSFRLVEMLLLRPTFALPRQHGGKPSAIVGRQRQERRSEFRKAVGLIVFRFAGASSGASGVFT